jgi:hypothetical protein
LNPETGEISLNLDLNSKTGEKSPDWGVHAAMLAGTNWLESSEPSRLAAAMLRAGARHASPTVAGESERGTRYSPSFWHCQDCFARRECNLTEQADLGVSA